MIHRTCRTWALAALALAAACATAAPQRTYQLYEPTVRRATIHEGKLAEGHYGYNHMASLAFFDGKFHCVWGGNAQTTKEGQPGQVVLWSTSEDFEHWTPPVHFVGEGAEDPVVEPEGKQWQPNLLNYHGRELWCLWCNASKEDDKGRTGPYFSRLGKGPNAPWTNRRLFHRHYLDGKPFVVFPAGDPWLCKSGRVLAPVTFYRRVEGLKERIQWNGCLYTDDDGATWTMSNPIGRIDDYWAQWEPFFFEQADGGLRCFMRNLTRQYPPCTQWQLTCTGTGAQKGEPVVFDPDPQYSHIETGNSRVYVLRTGGRHCMFQHDMWVDHRDYHTRLNLALFFSRSGRDDFVAGPPFSRRNVVSAYPQGIEHDGKLYVAYTVGAGTGPRGIEGAVIDPAPSPDQFYLWPRQKEIVKMEKGEDENGKQRMVRANPDDHAARPVLVEEDGRQVLRFEQGASAGVETDSVDLAKGQTLTLSLDVKITELQEQGNLILCSFGDQIPIRLGMPSNRKGTLYAYCADGWKSVGAFPLHEWAKLVVAFGPGEFSIRIGEAETTVLANPMTKTNPRLYLGDGYEVDYVRSNRGSAFLVDVTSVHTQVAPGTGEPEA